jgi:hypothetical protein
VKCEKTSERYIFPLFLIFSTSKWKIRIILSCDFKVRT